MNDLHSQIYILCRPLYPNWLCRRWELKGVKVRKNLDGGSDGKESVYNVGDLGSSPGLGRSPREGNGNPLQYYRLENPMDKGAW